MAGTDVKLIRISESQHMNMNKIETVGFYWWRDKYALIINYNTSGRYIIDNKSITQNIVIALDNAELTKDFGKYFK